MTETDLQMKPRGRMQENSQCARILRVLQSVPGEKFSMPALVDFSGSYNVHSRIDELRHVHGWTQIENETDVSVRPHKSFYWLPADNFERPQTP